MKPNYLTVVVLCIMHIMCMMQIAETTTVHRQHHDDSNCSDLPKDIIKKIAKYLRDDPENLTAVLFFLSKHDIEITKRYTQVLRSVLDDDQAFSEYADYLVEDANNLKNDGDYLRVMANIWSNYLKPNDNENGGNEQGFDFQLMADESATPITAAYNFLAALSKIDPLIQDKIVQLSGKAASTVGAFDFDKMFRLGTNFALSNLAGYLSYEAYVNLDLWWRGEISGERNAKNIIDSIAGVAGGIGGGMAGASIGSFILPGIGTAIGAIVGGAIGSTSSSLSDWTTQMIFNLPKEVALENAYKFLGLEYGASNDEINSSFRTLALKYHPNRGGSFENWQKLQMLMGIIKISKGEM